MGAFPEIPSMKHLSARTPVVWTPGTACFTIAVGVASAETPTSPMIDEKPFQVIADDS